MMMEIYLDEEKCKKNNVDANDFYNEIREYLDKYDIKEKTKGIYVGKDNSHCFTGFVYMVQKLPRLRNFMRVVDQWYWRVESDNIEDREDCLESNKYMDYILNKPEIDSLYEN